MDRRAWSAILIGTLTLPVQAYEAATDTGLVRNSNEDTFVAEEALGFFAVVDGMGGHSSGRLASQTVANGLVEFIRQSATDPDKTWPFGMQTGSWRRCAQAAS